MYYIYIIVLTVIHPSTHTHTHTHIHTPHVCMVYRDQMQRYKRNRHFRQRYMVYELANTFVICEREDTYTICNVILPNADHLDRKYLGWSTHIIFRTAYYSGHLLLMVS